MIFTSARIKMIHITGYSSSHSDNVEKKFIVGKYSNLKHLFKNFEEKWLYKHGIIEEVYDKTRFI